MEGIVQPFGESGGDFQELGHPSPICLTIIVNLGTVMVSVGVSFSTMMCYSETILRLKV